MALNNIFNEPRREIVEQIVGTAVLGAVVVGAAVADWHLAHHLGEIESTEDLVAGVLIAGLLLMMGIVLLIGFTFAAHALGDGICNALQNRGIHLRPRERRNVR